MSDPTTAAAAEVHRLATPAPTPPAPAGSLPTDSQGVRRYDSEDIKSHGLDPATTKKKSKTAPRAGSSSPIVQMTPVNDMRRVCATLPFREVRHPQANIFIPAFGMMFHLLAVMNDKVCSLRPFSDNGPANDWIPQVSNLVFAVLAIIQVLRAQELAGHLAPEQFLLLKQFVDRFPLELIEIPGPLVPFFRSLSVSAPGYGNYEDVAPALPTFTFTESSAYTIGYIPPGKATQFTPIELLVPNIALMYDQFVHLVSYLLVDDNKYSKYSTLSTIFGFAPPAANQPYASDFARHRRTVGLWHRPTATDGHMSRFARYIKNVAAAFPAPWKFDPEHAALAADATATPPRAARDATWLAYNSIYHQMMFDATTDWFATLLRGMQTFNRHWKGNQSLLHISPLTSTAGMILFKRISYETISSRSIFGDSVLNKASHQLVYNSQASTACPFIVNEDFEDAQIAQVNITSADPSIDGMRIGDVGVTRFGEFWDVVPDAFETERGNLTSQLQSIVVSQVFFSDQPITSVPR